MLGLCAYDDIVLFGIQNDLVGADIVSRMAAIRPIKHSVLGVLDSMESTTYVIVYKYTMGK